MHLVRLPNVFTVIADVLAGVTVARGMIGTTSASRAMWEPWPLTAILVISAIAFYWAGMILNDVFDVDKDRLQNRGRPLVEGRISISAARMVAYGFMLGGLIAILIGVSYFSRGENSPATEPLSWTIRYSTAIIAFGLVTAIWLYDSPFKATWIGPCLMGLCRVGSMLLGLSIGWWLEPTQSIYAPHFWMAAIGHGIYVMGITWAARREAEAKQTWTLAFGWVICLVGIAMLASVSLFVPEGSYLRLSPQTSYPIAIGLLSIPWARRAVFSVVSPNPQSIQAAVKQAIMSMIFFDATLALQFGGPVPALTICALILPAMIIGRYFRST